MGWLGDLFGGITNWVGGGSDDSGDSVLGSMIKSAIGGAVTGAAAAAISDNDIGQGAALGAVTFAAGSGLQEAFAKDAGVSRKEQRKEITEPEKKEPETKKSKTKSKPIDSEKTEGAKEKGYWSSDQGKRTLLNVGQGLLSGAASYYAQKDKRDAAEDKLELEYGLKRRNARDEKRHTQRLNRPGNFRSVPQFTRQ